MDGDLLQIEGTILWNDVIATPPLNQWRWVATGNAGYSEWITFSYYVYLHKKKQFSEVI